MRLFMILGLLAQCAAAQGTLIGRWRTVETSRGGIGAMYEFRGDGLMEYSPGAVVEMPYRVEGDQLIFPPATTTGPEQKSTIAWTGDDLFHLTVEGHDAGAYRRAAGTRRDPADRLLGEWLSTQDMDGQKMNVHTFFYPAGKSRLLIAFTTQTGRYSVTNGKLTATFGGRVGLEGAFSVANGILTIMRGGGRVLKLARY